MEDLINFDKLQGYKTAQFQDILNNSTAIEKFDSTIFLNVVEKLIVTDNQKIVIFFLYGREIECEI
jgi:hypothetical protein